MAELFLIAHKVRGEPAFDIAERMVCPECQGGGECIECDFDGYWWIVSTSGHRAYPFWYEHLHLLKDWDLSYKHGLPFDMPNGLPDHYPTKQSKPEKSSGKSLLAALGLLPKVQRRL